MDPAWTMEYMTPQVLSFILRRRIRIARWKFGAGPKGPNVQ